MAVGSEDDTLSDDGKRELAIGGAHSLNGDNLQHCTGQRVLRQKLDLVWKK